jgi:trk system potassium uptake protein TrkH
MLIALIYSESLTPFLYSLAICLSFGLFLNSASKGLGDHHDIRKKDAYLAVSLSWLMLGLIGALPYIFSGAIPSIVNAIFEAESGFSTTGSTILNDIESLPKSILFWRSLTHWIGGIGIIMLVIIILPSLKIGGYHLFTSESSFQDKIKPKIRQVGSRLLLIYLVLTAAETILLLIGKMSLFDSICHSFGTIATGGFSPKNDSIASYSPYIQYVIMIFMFLAGTNFIIYYCLVKGHFTKIKQNNEFRFYFWTVTFIGFVITAILFFKMNKPLEESFREAFFQVISIITCTGFATADYLNWTSIGIVIIFLSMFLGGCAGSTAGGIKMVRHLIVLKKLKSTFNQLLHPQAIIPSRLNGKSLSSETANSTVLFILLYLLVFVAGSLLMMIIGLDAESAGSAVATCMAGIGPGIGIVGPCSTFAAIPAVGKLLLCFLMIIGRLEIYTVLVLFSRQFWKS